MSGGQDSQSAVSAAIVALDKAARKGAIHPRNAARRKSRLIKRLSALGQRPMTMPAQPAPSVEPAAAKGGKRTPAVAEPKAKPEAKKTAAKAPAKKAPSKKTTKK